MNGERTTNQFGKITVPDIWGASVGVLDAAVGKAYQDKRKTVWKGENPESASIGIDPGANINYVSGHAIIENM